MPMRYLPFLLILLLSLNAVASEKLQLPIRIDFRLLEEVLSRQLLAGEETTVEAYSDGFGCNSLTLSSPRVSGTGEGQIRILTDLHARIGTPLGNRCLLPIEWRGVLETLEEVELSDDGKKVLLRIADSHILDEGESPSPAPGALWGLVKEYVHPHLQGLSLDLNPLMTGLQTLLGNALTEADLATAQGIIASIALNDLAIDEEHLSLSLSLEAPNLSEQLLPAAPEVLTDAELAQWDAAWQAWDGFATWLIKTLAQPSDEKLATALAEILLEARYDLRNALASDDRHQDPVRSLFVKTWERLTPLLRDANIAYPGADVLQYTAFVTAADVLAMLDSTAPQLGLSIDSATLRSLARLLLPSVNDADLSYSTDIDPVLRSLLGFDPDFAEDTVTPRPFAWLIPSAQAGTVNPALVKKLTGWIPAPSERDDYLKTVHSLLAEIVRSEPSSARVPQQFTTIFQNLVFATAWQETCWRQFIVKGGKVQPILSPAGSVGLMQINKHVWRGIYDLEALHENIGYNARAGNEILVHYLVDYAIKNGEHNVDGDIYNLARATYAAYNGGPGHLTRYRRPNTGTSLKTIDAAFWKKYQAIQKNAVGAVMACYGP